ncbi:MAG: virulence RhuM family protein [Sphingobacterium sp.]|nr:virulence RhuM family protein [Sphingobacterium sp.]
MDDERLKNPDGRPDYFDEMLERIRDIRASEKRFYQKVRDLFALSSDYDKSDRATQQFFATMQNLLLYAVTQLTAAELVSRRADPADPHFGLLSWKGGKVRKSDILIAKNYLTEDEIDTLNRLVVIFLETAELRAKRQTLTPMAFWQENVGQIITANGFPLLTNAGSISHARMEQQVGTLFQDYDQRRKAREADAADREDEAELKALEDKIKHRSEEVLMTKEQLSQLGKTLWAIADRSARRDERGRLPRLHAVVPVPALPLGQLRGGGARRSWARTTPQLATGRPPRAAVGLVRGQPGRRARVREADAPQGALRDPARSPLEQHRRTLARTQDRRTAATPCERGFKYIENESFASTFQGLFSEINLSSEKLGTHLRGPQRQALRHHHRRSPRDSREFSTDIDTLGDAYEYLIGQFAAGSGKKAGEFYTPQQISTILSAHRHPRQPGAGHRQEEAARQRARLRLRLRLAAAQRPQAAWGRMASARSTGRRRTSPPTTWRA